jgi:hypothetical protein
LRLPSLETPCSCSSVEPVARITGEERFKSGWFWEKKYAPIAPACSSPRARSRRQWRPPLDLFCLAWLGPRSRRPYVPRRGDRPLKMGPPAACTPPPRRAPRAMAPPCGRPLLAPARWPGFCSRPAPGLARPASLGPGPGPGSLLRSSTPPWGRFSPLARWPADPLPGGAVSQWIGGAWVLALPRRASEPRPPNANSNSLEEPTIHHRYRGQLACLVLLHVC